MMEPLWQKIRTEEEIREILGPNSANGIELHKNVQANVYNNFFFNHSYINAIKYNNGAGTFPFGYLYLATNDEDGKEGNNCDVVTEPRKSLRTSNNADYVDTTEGQNGSCVGFINDEKPGKINKGVTLYSRNDYIPGELVKNPTKFDFHLVPGSPALIDAGTKVSGITDDFDGDVDNDGKLIPGDTRPQPAGGKYDIGADEYCAPGTSGCKQP
jgi:hypothetical protein